MIYEFLTEFHPLTIFLTLIEYTLLIHITGTLIHILVVHARTHTYILCNDYAHTHNTSTQTFDSHVHWFSDQAQEGHI
jgi:hypothetical protein